MSKFKIGDKVRYLDYDTEIVASDRFNGCYIIPYKHGWFEPLIPETGLDPNVKYAYVYDYELTLIEPPAPSEDEPTGLTVIQHLDAIANHEHGLNERFKHTPYVHLFGDRVRASGGTITLGEDYYTLDALIDHLDLMVQDFGYKLVKVED